MRNSFLVRRTQFCAKLFSTLLPVLCAASISTLLSAACFSNERAAMYETPSQKPNSASTPATARNSLKIEISPANTEWHDKEPIWVNVYIHNGTSSELRGLAAFELSPVTTMTKAKAAYNSLWAPANLVSDATGDTKTVFPVVIESGQELKVKLDLSGLKWGRRVQSVWPDTNLFQLITSGPYQLTLEIQQESSEGMKVFRSPSVTVRL